MTHKYSWLVMTKDHGLVQVDADRCSAGLAGNVAFHKSTEDGEYLLCSFAQGMWSSVEIMSQVSGYGNGFTKLKMESLNA